MTEKLLTVAEVAERLQISRSKVYELKQKIGYIKIGHGVRFTEEDLARYLESCRPGPPPEPVMVRTCLQPLYLPSQQHQAPKPARARRGRHQISDSSPTE